LKAKTFKAGSQIRITVAFADAGKFVTTVLTPVTIPGSSR
jgi:hypothetical protein